MKKRIFTHSGIFHADDVFCVAASLLIWPEAEVFRVRQLPEDFGQDHKNFFDVALDVGGVYDPRLMMFDHHQEHGNADGMAAIGKFWKETGVFVIDELYPELSTDIIGQVAEYVENSIVTPIDRGDIGIKDWQPTEEAIENGWSHLSAARLISSCNAPFGSSEEVQMDHFMTAVRMAQLSLRGTISQGIEFCRMRTEVAKAAEKRSLDSEKYHYLVLEEPGPWQAHILSRQDLEDVLYVIFPSDRGGWMVQCVPDALDSFGKRKELPAEWAGLRGEEFASKVGLTQSGSATFCHPGRFIAGAENLEDAKFLAVLAIKN
jgi:uncharacterized UPF0160 family protein